MAVSRAAASSIEELTTDVRRELGDPATTPAGDTIPAGARRFVDSEIQRVINNALIKLQMQLTNRHPGESLVHATLSYSETATTTPLGNDLPSGVDANAIFKVEDASAPSGIAEPLQYVSLHEIQRYERTEDQVTTLTSRYWYTLVDRGTAHGIIIRPRPDAAHSFRVWYVAQPLVYSATSDQPALATRFRELIALEASVALASPAQERLSDLQILRLQDCRKDFIGWCSRARGPQRVRRVERGRW